MKPFQSGVELESAMLWDAFVLDDTASEVEVSERISFDSDVIYCVIQLGE